VDRREDFLIDSGKKTDVKIENLRQEKLIQEKRRMSFKPEITVVAQKLFSKKSSAATFSGLYEDALKRQNTSKSDLHAEFTFTPKTTKYKKKEISQPIKCSSKVNLQEYMENKTKELTFSPKINKNAKNTHTEQKVGEKLYKIGIKTKEKIAAKIEENHKILKEQASPKNIQKKSEQLLRKMEKDKFNSIFDALDSDKDGFISAKKVDIKILSLQLLEILSPILKEMEDKNEQWDSSTFIEKVNEKYRTLTTYDKKAILDFKKQTQKIPENPSFSVFLRIIIKNSQKLINYQLKYQKNDDHKEKIIQRFYCAKSRNLTKK